MAWRRGGVRRDGVMAWLRGCVACAGEGSRFIGRARLSGTMQAAPGNYRRACNGSVMFA